MKFVDIFIDKGVKQRQISLPEDGTLSTMGSKSALSSNSYAYSTYSTAKLGKSSRIFEDHLMIISVEIN